MKVLFITFLVFLVGNQISVFAEEAIKKPEPTKEEPKYCFGAIELPNNFFTLLDPDPDDRQDDDPFGGGGKKGETRHHPDRGRFVPKSKLPRCLPAHPMYRDVAEILGKQGVSIGENQWALVSTGPEGDLHLYYCLNLTSADVLESIMMACHHCGPVNLRHRLTLVSVPNQGLANVAWTPERLNSLSPMIHARYGTVGYSGERSIVTFEDKAHDSHIDIALSPARGGEWNHLTDIYLEINLNWNTPNAPNISQKASFTQETNKPFILDCGKHGVDGRNYLMMIESGDLPHLFHHKKFHHSKRIKLEKIDGIYAMNPDGKGDVGSKIESTFKNYAFRCAKGFLDTVNLHLDTGADMDDPFGEKKSSQPVPHAARIKGFKPNKHMQAGHTVFDVTPHFRQLGLSTYKNERVYFNETTSKLIARGTVSMPSRIAIALDWFNRFPRMSRVNASIVEVKVQGFPAPDWTMDLVAQNQVKHLARYTTTSRSGEKAVSGKETKRSTTKDDKTGKDVVSRNYEFEVETTIGEESDRIDLRFSVHSQPLGTDKISISIDSAMTIPDGKPVIIDLGHPNSATHTHLLILNADVITTNGSFYRDRFKPVSE